MSVLFVQKELLSLKRNKSPGIDNLPPNLLKDGAREIAKPLCRLINQSLTESVVPIEWKHAKITPIHKSGTLENPDNYRPISVLPALSKILEKAVHQQLISYLEKHNLLSDKQFGYRKYRSTELAVNLFVDDIRKSIDDGKLVGALFVDLSKAFDTISHSTLLAKLPTYGIHEVELDWFRDYLFNRHQQVFYEKERSNVFEVVCGVPQGSVLGPLLFTMNMYICSNFHDYFTVRKSGCVTRNSHLLVKLPKCKLEVAKSGFYYTGAKMYNDLPLNIRKEKNFNLFKKLLSLI